MSVHKHTGIHRCRNIQKTSWRDVNN